MTFYFIQDKPGAPALAMNMGQILSEFKMPLQGESAYGDRCRQGGESVEDVFYDYMRTELRSMPASAEDFNQLVNCLIIALEGGNTDPWLEADKVELHERYLAEIDAYRQDPPVIDYNRAHAVNFWLAFYRSRSVKALFMGIQNNIDTIVKALKGLRKKSVPDRFPEDPRRK